MFVKAFSARRVKQSAHRLVFCELVVKLDGFGCGQYLRFNLTFFQKIQSLKRDFEALLHPAREHEHLGAAVEQLLHICDLNAWNVLGTGLPPVPFARSTGKELRVLIRL